MRAAELPGVDAPASKPDHPDRMPRDRRGAATRSTKPDTPSRMTPVNTDARPARRPQWRGERQALLVRVPAGLAEQLRAEAGRSRRSLSDTAAALIEAGLAHGGRP